MSLLNLNCCDGFVCTVRNRLQNAGKIALPDTALSGRYIALSDVVFFSGPYGLK